MKKIVGLSIISLSSLCLALVIMMAQISMYIDQTTPESNSRLSFYLPNNIYILIAIPIVIGLYILFRYKNNE